MADNANDKTAQKAQNFYNKGSMALERGNLDFAIELLLEALTIAPDYTIARKTLRAAQIMKFRKESKSPFALKLQDVSASLTRMKIASLSKKGKHAEAMLEADKLLTGNPLSGPNIECAVNAAEAAGQKEAALITIEAAYENNQDDLDLLERVADYYVATKNFDKAKEAYGKLNAFRPKDQRILKMLKDCEARATMAAGWEDVAGTKGGFVNLIANKEQSKKLDIANKAIVSGDDAEAVIAEAKARLEKEPNNMNFTRALARVYMQNKRFAEAAETLESAQKLNAADPELDRMLSTVRIAAFEQSIEQLKAEGKTEEAADVENKKNQYVFDDLAARVQRYPNDLKLRFELGMQYYTYDFPDDAIQQFQLAQKSPKERLHALYYLAMCFLKKGQRDMAVMQLETANEQLPLMDDLKKNVVYQLGDLAEQAGAVDKAFAYYKEVYSADIGFKDIDKRMERIYQARKTND